MKRDIAYGSFRKTPRSRRRLYGATGLVLFILLIDALSGGAIRSRLQPFTADVYFSVEKVYTDVLANGFFSSRSALGHENQSLQQQVQTLQERLAADSVIESQDAQLRAIAGIAAQEPGITAPIVSSFRSSPYGTFIVGAGEAQGVATGDLVEDGGGFVIGRITSVDSSTALVSELFAPRASVDALVDGAAAPAAGQGGGNARMQIPHGVTINVGDPVTSSMVGGKAIGIVGKVVSDPSEAYMQVYVALPVNLTSLQYVYIVKQ